MALDDLMNVSDMLADNKALNPLMDALTQIMELDDTKLNDQAVEAISGAMRGAFTDSIKESAVKSMIEQFEAQNMTKRAVESNLNTFKTQMTALVLEELHPSAYKKELLDALFAPLYEMFEMAVERYHNFDITLPIKLDEGAQMPTYAHDTDAAADLYAADDITIPAHTISNMVRTGVHIVLPENWVAIIVPRSSIGMKTGLRLSNSQGVIDADYRGPLGVIYDNISDSDYEIKAGDRIAQMYIMPTYRFKGVEVDELTNTERGEGGFGSSGK